MLLFGTNFWPLFWTVVGAGAGITVILSLLVAVIPVARHDRQRPVPVAPLRRHAHSSHTQAA